jgi:hypothetical protein
MQTWRPNNHLTHHLPDFSFPISSVCSKPTCGPDITALEVKEHKNGCGTHNSLRSFESAMVKIIMSIEIECVSSKVFWRIALPASRCNLAYTFHTAKMVYIRKEV